MQVLEAFRIIRQVDDACIDVFVGARNFSRNLQVNQVPTHEVVLARAVHSYYFVHLCALQKLLFCTVSAIDRTKRGFKNSSGTTLFADYVLEIFEVLRA
jgi:hypothetical protein